MTAFSMYADLLMKIENSFICDGSTRSSKLQLKSRSLKEDSFKEELCRPFKCKFIPCFDMKT